MEYETSRGTRRRGGRVATVSRNRKVQIIESLATIKLDYKDRPIGAYHRGFFGDALTENDAVKDGILYLEVVYNTRTLFALHY